MSTSDDENPVRSAFGELRAELLGGDEPSAPAIPADHSGDEPDVGGDPGTITTTGSTTRGGSGMSIDADALDALKNMLTDTVEKALKPLEKKISNLEDDVKKHAPKSEAEKEAERLREVLAVAGEAVTEAINEREKQKKKARKKGIKDDATKVAAALLGLGVEDGEGGRKIILAEPSTEDGEEPTVEVITSTEAKLRHEAEAERKRADKLEKKVEKLEKKNGSGKNGSGKKGSSGLGRLFGGGSSS